LEKRDISREITSIVDHWEKTDFFYYCEVFEYVVHELTKKEVYIYTFVTKILKIKIDILGHHAR